MICNNNRLEKNSGNSFLYPGFTSGTNKGTRQGSPRLANFARK
ncbi:hypothetical protein B0I18_101796 [Taibaiella chishuiensis]|uniref:Uncharacterized protein n=1 Tax=Taibaiella chishuiensis TaxID=1434707 RepID=A0A2P8DBT0_9BACT|nr:hypothetical protein B0I18_101796 [Taibaiella chishuiensis]